MNQASQKRSSNEVVLGDEMTTRETEGNLLGQSRMRYWGKYTFRVRTAVILTLFILLTALAVGFAFRNVVSILLDNQTNLDLRDDAQEFVEQLESITGPISQERAQAWNRHAATHELHHWFLRVFDQDENVVWETISVPEATMASHLSEDGMQEFENYRFLNRPIYRSSANDKHIPTGWIQVGCSLELIQDSLSQLDRLLLWVFLIVGVLGPVASLFLSAQLLNPLTDLTKQAAELSVTDRSQLLGLRGSGDELDSLAGTVNALLARVRSQLQANEDWIANSAHQLRSPLAAITSNVEVVLGRMPDGKSSDMLASVLNECEYLNKLVQQLLLLSEANAVGVKAKRSEIRWDEMIRQSSDFFEALASAKDVSLTFDTLMECTVFANPEHLRIVLHNIIDNAIKYTQSNGSIEIELTTSIENECTLRVSDTGIGISEEDLVRVSRRFFRSDSGRDPATTPRGTGLGLNIVKTIVEGLDGRLQIESILGGGTTVRIVLPTIG
jgi:signal transduction histidine kinase